MGRTKASGTSYVDWEAAVAPVLRFHRFSMSSDGAGDGKLLLSCPCGRTLRARPSMVAQVLATASRRWRRRGARPCRAAREADVAELMSR